MTPYQLAKIILMAGGVKSRKRIQKTFHLLQAAGCSFDLDYRMHHYGPYSAELAESLDRMARERLILETEQATEVGPQYDYLFNEEHISGLRRFEASPQGQVEQQRLERYLPLVREFCDTRARVLELASTLVEFRQGEGEWDDAVEKTAAFKAEPVDSPNMRQAKRLAETVVAGKGDG